MTSAQSKIHFNSQHPVYGMLLTALNSDQCHPKLIINCRARNRHGPHALPSIARLYQGASAHFWATVWHIALIYFTSLNRFYIYIFRDRKFFSKGEVWWCWFLQTHILLFCLLFVYSGWSGAHLGGSNGRSELWTNHFISLWRFQTRKCTSRPQS